MASGATTALDATASDVTDGPDVEQGGGLVAAVGPSTAVVRRKGGAAHGVDDSSFAGAGPERAAAAPVTGTHRRAVAQRASTWRWTVLLCACVLVTSVPLHQWRPLVQYFAALNSWQEPAHDSDGPDTAWEDRPGPEDCSRLANPCLMLRHVPDKPARDSRAEPSDRQSLSDSINGGTRTPVYVRAVPGGVASGGTADGSAAGRHGSDARGLDLDDWAPATALRVGRATTRVSKGSYNLRLEQERSVAGLPPHTDWFLYAAYDDFTMLGLPLAMRLYERFIRGLDDLLPDGRVGPPPRPRWAPHTRYINVFLNGYYEGLYVLVEEVNFGHCRLPGVSGTWAPKPFVEDGSERAFLNKHEIADHLVLPGNWRMAKSKDAKAVYARLAAARLDVMTALRSLGEDDTIAGARVAATATEHSRALPGPDLAGLAAVILTDEVMRQDAHESYAYGQLPPEAWAGLIDPDLVYDFQNVDHQAEVSRGVARRRQALARGTPDAAELTETSVLWGPPWDYSPLLSNREVCEDLFEFCRPQSFGMAIGRMVREVPGVRDVLLDREAAARFVEVLRDRWESAALSDDELRASGVVLPQSRSECDLPPEARPAAVVSPAAAAVVAAADSAGGRLRQGGGTSHGTDVAAGIAAFISATLQELGAQLDHDSVFDDAVWHVRPHSSRESVAWHTRWFNERVEWIDDNFHLLPDAALQESAGGVDGRVADGRGGRAADPTHTHTVTSTGFMMVASVLCGYAALCAVLARKVRLLLLLPRGGATVGDLRRRGGDGAGGGAGLIGRVRRGCGACVSDVAALVSAGCRCHWLRARHMRGAVLEATVEAAVVLGYAATAHAFISTGWQAVRRFADLDILNEDGVAWLTGECYCPDDPGAPTESCVLHACYVSTAGELVLGVIWVVVVGVPVALEAAALAVQWRAARQR